jgi:hypothetical protein
VNAGRRQRRFRKFNIFNIPAPASSTQLDAMEVFLP